ncbi:YetF domain-containing protein [Streptomyces macrosporus]|uniref:YetF C-terminal domain-containing protein n=1 Tax=Streptomyces macrosporus TaxID=44032 RepID=A0ABN3KJB4_9ACTN
MQFVNARVAVGSGRFRRLIKTEPTLLRDGRLLGEAMARQRVTAGEARRAIRSQGIGAVEEVAAVGLETDGSFSVLPRLPDRLGQLLTGRPGVDRGTAGQTSAERDRMEPRIGQIAGFTARMSV